MRPKQNGWVQFYRNGCQLSSPHLINNDKSILVYSFVMQCCCMQYSLSYGLHATQHKHPWILTDANWGVIMQNKFLSSSLYNRTLNPISVTNQTINARTHYRWVVCTPLSLPISLVVLELAVCCVQVVFIIIQNKLLPCLWPI